jgi:hypothetical protein
MATGYDLRGWSRGTRTVELLGNCSYHTSVASGSAKTPSWLCKVGQSDFSATELPKVGVLGLEEGPVEDAPLAEEAPVRTALYPYRREVEGQG